MARAFVAASSQFLERASAVRSAAPLTIAAWFKPATTGGDHTISGIYSAANTTNYFELVHSSTTLLAITADTPNGAVSASSSGTLSAGAWTHGVAVFGSSTSRDCFINGANKGSNATSCTPASLDTTSVGRRGHSAPTNYFGGDVGEVAIWNVALDDAEVAALAAGVSPLLIRPTALVTYWPIIGNFSPEIDRVGRFELTVTGATAAAHPPVWYPSSSAHIAHMPPVIPVDQLQWRPVMPDLLLDTSVECVASGFTPRSPTNPTDPTPT